MIVIQVRFFIIHHLIEMLNNAIVHHGGRCTDCWCTANIIITRLGVECPCPPPSRRPWRLPSANWCRLFIFVESFLDAAHPSADRIANIYVAAGAVWGRRRPCCWLLRDWASWAIRCGIGKCCGRRRRTSGAVVACHYFQQIIQHFLMLHSAGNNRRHNDNIASEICSLNDFGFWQHAVKSMHASNRMKWRGGPLVGTARVPTGVFHCAERFTCIPSLASSVMWRVYRYKTPYVWCELSYFFLFLPTYR